MKSNCHSILVLVLAFLMLLGSSAMKGEETALSGPWPECVTMSLTGTACVELIQRDSPDLTGKVIIVQPGEPVIMNYDTGRVFVFIDEEGIVIKTPKRG